MSYIDYIEIENFKGFGAKVRVPLGNPCVLIGPNNSGKTTVLQALSLWGRAVFEWWDAKVKGRLEGDGSVVVNRLAILDVPVKEARCLWHGLKTQNEQGPIPIVLTVGVRMPDGANRPLKMVFHYRMAEGVACEPVDCADDLVLMETASKLRFGLLHPMSGIASAVSDSTDEPLVAPGRVNVLLGQGQTAQALRNVCYALWEKSPKDWHCVVDMMRRIFKCAFEDPVFDPGRGSLYLSYRQDGVDAPLEIAMSGRGLQQMLLMLAYLYDHKGQVVLVDEPDAHLEILRQRQAFAILREIADETRTQIAVVTHSEVILDEAFESNLVSLAHAHVAELSLRPDIRTTLRNIGVQHYYNAELKKRLLIVEGSTDVAMLREFAALLDHPASAILNDTLFSFYTQEADADVVGIPPVEQYETAGLGYRRFYSTLKHLIPELRAVALFDGDGRDIGDESVSDDFKILRWRRYEFENYFITPERIEAYVLAQTGEGRQPVIRSAINEVLAEMVFDANAEKVQSYYQIPAELRENFLAHTKMSLFAERVFRRFAALSNSPILLNKGDFFKLIRMLKREEVPSEVVQRLDAIFDILNLNSADDSPAGAINDSTGEPVKTGCEPVKKDDGPVKSGSEPVNMDGGPVKTCGEPVNLEECGPVKLLEIIRNNPGLRKNKLAEMANLPESKVKRYIEDVLVGRVEFRGAPKTGGYYVL